MTCPECGARNPETADWCGQCYASLHPDRASDETSGATSRPAPDPGRTAPVEGLAARRLDPDPDALPPTLQALGEAAGARPTPPPSSPAQDLPAAPPLPGVDPALQPGPEPQGPEGEPEVLGDGRFRRTQQGLEWACAVCREWNPMELVACTVCGTSFGAGPAAQQPPPVPDVAEPVLAATSVVWPGAGHLLLGRRAEGFVRMLLSLVWAAGGLALLRGALGSGRPVFPAIPLLFGWIVLAVACTNDALVLGGTKGRVLLEPRMLLWLVVGVVGGTAAGALVGVLQVTGG